MLVWLLPVSLFWIVAAIYVGGFDTRIVGGTGPRQVLGLLATFGLFVLVWGLLRWALGNVGGNFFWHALVPTALSILGLPLIVRTGFAILGMRVDRGAAAH